MKFKEALDKVLDDVMPREDGIENAVSPQTAKILALFWNMIAASENVLDDFVYIDKNNNIHSVPKESLSEDGQKPSTGKKAATKKTGKKKDDDAVVNSDEEKPVDDGEEEQATENTTEPTEE